MKLHALITIEIPEEYHNDPEWTTLALRDIEEALCYEFLEEVTVTHLPSGLATKLDELPSRDS